ncbi:unnamed protein product [Rotaria sordida]|uniref:Uncharacterized protein n=1 Tax=Rotaria sordida TaxID=392033 RepID=A0A814F6U3_9BILA|nr:unnamed protein product [Rotaria sordida]
MSRTHISPLIKAQVEKLTANGVDITSGHRLIRTSSPIIIPKKPTLSNTSSQNSSYGSIPDQMSSLGDTPLQLHRESDNASNTSLPTLSSTYQQLEHSAARDRIAVKNKRQQPSKYKLSILKENNDDQVDLFSSRVDDVQENFPLHTESKIQSKSVIDLYNLGRARDHLRKSVFLLLSILKENNDDQVDLFSSRVDDVQENFPLRTESKIQSKSVIDLSNLGRARDHLRKSVFLRDHSADNIPSPTISTIPTYVSSVQRSISFKRPQEINQTPFINRSMFTIKKDKEREEENKHESILKDINANNSYSTPLTTYSSSQEHIYDNSNVFHHHKTNIIPDSLPNENESLTNNIAKTREQSIPRKNRVRPFTMYIPTNNDKQTINEFESVFNQIKKNGLIKKLQSKEETAPISPPKESVQPPSPSILIDETSTNLSIEHEPIVPAVVVPTNKIVETSYAFQPLNRRKTVGGSNLPTNNKVITDDNNSKPSWIDIAKQKQNKVAVLSDKSHNEESEQQQTTPIEPEIVPKKQVIMSSNPTATVNEITSDDTPTFNPAIVRRLSSRIPQTNTHVVERDSIRALKASNPNRINNLIHLFDK